jgi:hypothetical protein
MCYLHFILNLLFLGCNYTRMASARAEEFVGGVEGVVVGANAGRAVAPAAVKDRLGDQRGGGE